MEKVYSTEKITAENRIDILYKVRDNIDVIGWELVDDRIATNNQVVFKSTGNDVDTSPCYVLLTIDPATVLRFEHCTYYSFDTKQFFNRLSHYYNSPDYNSGAMRCDDNSYNEIILKGNKDFIYLEVLRPSTISTSAAIVFRVNDTFWENKIGFTQEDTNIGADVEVQLGPGQASYFKTGATYRIVSPVGHVAKSTVTGFVDTVNDKVTFDSIPYTLASGTRIGPAPFPWVCTGVKHSWGANYNITGLIWSVGNSYTTGRLESKSFSIRSLLSTSLCHYNQSNYVMSPSMFYDTNGILGSFDYMYYCTYGSHKSSIGIDNILNGRVYSSTIDYIHDEELSLIEDILKDMGIIITSGSQEFTTRRIVSNTATTIYVDPPFPGPIEASETFSVCESFYRKMPWFQHIGSHMYLRDI